MLVVSSDHLSQREDGARGVWGCLVHTPRASRGANVGRVARGRARERASLGNELPDATWRNADLRSCVDVMDVDVNPCLTPSAGPLGAALVPLAWLGDAFTSHLRSRALAGRPPHHEIPTRKAEPGLPLCLPRVKVTSSERARTSQLRA